MRAPAYISILILSLSALSVKGQMNVRGCEITYQNVGYLTYAFNVAICSYTNQSQDIVLHYGDGITDTLSRDSVIQSLGWYNGEVNYYSATHTYVGPSTYEISVGGLMRSYGIINVGFSGTEELCVATSLVITPFLTENNSVQFQNCPCPVYACVNQSFCNVYPTYDPDGDSLSYELIPASGTDCLPMPVPFTYQYPGYYGGQFTLDTLTGEICWNAPQSQGDYNIAVRIHEWRQVSPGNYFEVGYVTRDFQIPVFANCSSLGVTGQNALAEVNLYPNPATTELQIVAGYPQRIDFSIRDVLGKTQYQGQFQQKTQLDLTNFSSGLYFMIFQMGDQSLTRTFVKE